MDKNLEIMLTQLKDTKGRVKFVFDCNRVISGLIGKIKDFNDEFICLEDGEKIRVSELEGIENVEQDEKADTWLEMTEQARELQEG